MLLCLNLGLKNLYEGEGEVPPFFAAACELVLGLLPIVGELKHTQRFVSIAANSMPHTIYYMCTLAICRSGQVSHSNRG